MSGLVDLDNVMYIYLYFDECYSKYNFVVQKLLAVPVKNYM